MTVFDDSEKFNEQLRRLPTPCYLIDEKKLVGNLQRIDELQRRAGCRVLLALKGFAAFSLFPLVAKYLHGVSASSLFEAKLGAQEFGKPVHLFSPAYRDDEFDELQTLASHIVFNSQTQWRKFGEIARRNCCCGIRVNPLLSVVQTDIYNPCKKDSRLGVTAGDAGFLRRAVEKEGLQGLHFHALCGHYAADLQTVVNAVCEQFGDILSRKNLRWINLGGGHLLAADDYDGDKLIDIVDSLRRRYEVQVFLEPAEGVVLNAACLAASVLDILPNGAVIVDASATAHAPDVLEMPYRPEVWKGGKAGDYPHTYTLGGPTCLAGDVFGEYSFAKPLTVGARVAFLDMASYTMVKNTTFNGVPLPAIAVARMNGDLDIVRRFDYSDFRNRLS